MNRIKKIIREPLVHFLLIGGALFLVYHFANDPVDDSPNRIVVTSGQVEQMKAKFNRTWMRPPSKKEMEGLVESYVRDEVYYREALAMGLDRNDQSVRQRMRMKLEYLLEDLSDISEPDEDTLVAYMQEHQDRFRLEAQVSFLQVYLSPDRRQDLEADAAKILAQLKQGAAPESVGDPTMVQGEYSLARESDIERQFGESFARQVVELAPGDWVGPLFSGLGVHLVKVTDHVESRLPELAEIRDQVEREYMAQRRKELKDGTYQKLRAGYEVIVEPPTRAAVEERNSQGAVAVSLKGEDGK